MHACTLLHAAYAHKPISFVAFRTFVSCNCAFRTLQLTTSTSKLDSFIFSRFCFLSNTKNYNKPISPVSNFVLTETFNKFCAVRFGLVIWRFLYLENYQVSGNTRCWLSDRLDCTLCCTCTVGHRKHPTNGTIHEAWEAWSHRTKPYSAITTHRRNEFDQDKNVS